MRRERFTEVSETKSLEDSEYRAHTKGTERKGSHEVSGIIFLFFSYSKGDGSDKLQERKNQRGLNGPDVWGCRRGPVLWPYQES